MFNSFQNNRKIKFDTYNINEFLLWLLKIGFLPEGNILPPCFISEIELKENLYYPIVKGNKKSILKGLDKNSISDAIVMSTPKGILHERNFGIIDPKKYHDIIKHIGEDITTISNILFNENNQIYSFGFPFPINTIGDYDNLFIKRRSGEFIKSYLKAEQELLSESYKYKYLLKTDIKNFYPSIYTHTIPRAIHSKDVARSFLGDMSLLGNRIDSLLQKGNDNRTNGIVIGSILSDFIAEILLSKVDLISSEEIKKVSIDFFGIRFKDDYKILCHSRKDANEILKILNNNLKEYNLYLNEEKTGIENNLPDVIFRPRILEVDKLYREFIEEIRENNVLIRKKKIGIKKFQQLYREILKINDKYPNHGVFEKILSKLIYIKNNNYDHCFLLRQGKYSEFELLISLLLQITKKRPQTLPIILGILEKLIPNDPKNIVYKFLKDILDNSNSEYEILWLLYFFRKQQNWWHSTYKTKYKNHDNKFISSLANNTQNFFTEFDLFNNQYHNHKSILNSVSVFGYDQLI